MECEERESYAFWFYKVFQDLLISELASYTLLVLYFSLAPRNQVVNCFVWEQKIIRNIFPLQSRLSGCQVVSLCCLEPKDYPWLAVHCHQLDKVVSWDFWSSVNIFFLKNLISVT